MALESLFGNRIKPSCGYCEYAYPIDADKWMCSKKGTPCYEDPCRNYKYDPLMRVPRRPLEMKKFEAEDFSL